MSERTQVSNKSKNDSRRKSEFISALSYAIAGVVLLALTWHLQSLVSAFNKIEKYGSTVDSVRNVGRRITDIHSQILVYEISQNPTRLETLKTNLTQARRLIDPLKSLSAEPELKADVSSTLENFTSWVDFTDAMVASADEHKGRFPSQDVIVCDEMFQTLRKTLWSTVQKGEELRTAVKDAATETASRLILSAIAAIIGAVVLIFWNRRRESVLLEKIISEKAKIQKFFDQASEGIFVFDSEGRFSEINQAGCRLLGYDRSKLIGTSLRELLPAESRPLYDRAIVEMMHEPRRTHYAEWTIRRADGTLIPTEISARATSGGQWQGFARDISKKRELEQRKEILANMSRMIVGSLRADEMAEILLNFCANEISDCCSMTVADSSGRISRKLAVHRDPSKVLLMQELSKLALTDASLSVVREVLQTKQAQLYINLENKIPTRAEFPDQATNPLETMGIQSLVIVPMISGQREMGTLSFINERVNFTPDDVHFLTQVANLVALSLENVNLFEKAEKAIRAREEVIGIVSHDLKNPLSAIQGGIEIVKRFDLPKMPEEFRTATAGRLDGLLRSLNRAFELINNFLDVTKIEAGKLSIERKSASPGQILDAVLEVISPIAKKNEIEITAELECQDAVFADSSRINQVLWNLLGNAIQYSPAKSRITLRTSRLSDSVCFSVEDQGCGIQPEHIPHIFDRYWRAQKSNQQNLGLGLSIAKGIITAHGGEIWVESEHGQGTKFLFTLPLAPNASAYSGPGQAPVSTLT